MKLGPSYLIHPSIALLLLLSSSQTVFSQKIAWSEPVEMSSVFNTNEIIQASSENIYIAHKYKDEEYYFRQKLGHYNQRFEKKERAAAFDLNYKGIKADYQFGLSVQGKPYLCFLAHDKITQKISCLVDELNTKTLKSSQHPIRLFEVDYNKKNYDFEGFKSCASQDESKWLFYGKMPYYNKKDKAQIGMFVANANFEELASGAAQIPQKAARLSLEDVVDAVLDNEGNAYLLCKVYKAKSKKEERKIGTRFIYTIIKMNKEAKVRVLDTLNVLEIKDSALVVSAKLSVNNATKTVTCIGTYKTPSKKSALFSCRLDLDKWDAGAKIAYPQAFAKAAYVSPKQEQNKKKYGLKNYKIKTIFEQPNGDKIVLAEQHYTKIYLDKSEGRQEIHKLRNIFVASITTKQEIRWIKTIQKRQEGGGVGYTEVPQKLYSFFACQVGDKIHILYNDLEENLGVEDELDLAALDCNNPKDCSLMLCSFNADSGEKLRQKSLFQLKEEGFVVFPRATVLLEDGSFLFSGRKPEKGAKVKAQYRLGRLVLE